MEPMTIVAVPLLLLVLQGGAQTPPRDARPSPHIGTAVLRGIVVDEPTGAPIAGARVTVTEAGSDRGTGAGFTAETLTSADGRFEIPGLPAGRFIVIAEPGEFRASHLRKILGADDPNSFMGRPSLELAVGEVKTDVRIVLRRALAIDGRVIDEFGDPMADVAVIAKAEGLAMFGGRAVTDDRGRFRLFRLSAGQYSVCAEPRRSWEGGPVPEGVSTRYDQACLKGVILGKEDATPTLQLQPQRVGTFTVSGTVVSSIGSDVAAARVTLFGIGPDGISSAVGSEVRDGRFVARGLLPGEYLVQATLEDRQQDQSELREMASLSLNVEGSDVTGLTLTTVPGVSVVGRIERDPRATAPLPSRVAPTMRPPLDRLRYANYRTPSTVLGENGAFTIKGIFGPQVVAIRDLPAGWFIASVRHGDDDITDQAREFRNGDDRQVVIVLSDRSATLRARPVGKDGQPAPEGFVLIVPADPKRWNGMPYFGQPSVDKEGFFTIPGRAPGDYIVTAVGINDLMGLTRRTGAIEPIARAGRLITLVEGETLTIDVPLAAVGSGR